MATGLMHNMREGGKLIVRAYPTVRGDEADWPVDSQGNTWFASFVGWGSSLVGLGASREDALRDLTEQSRIPTTDCVIREG